MALLCSKCTWLQSSYTSSIRVIKAATCIQGRKSIRSIRELSTSNSIVTKLKHVHRIRISTVLQCRTVSQSTTNFAMENVSSMQVGGTSASNPVEGLLDFEIPPAPPLPETPVESAKEIIYNALGEPTLQSLGLGNPWTPAGWVQNALEFVHVSLDIPWWSSIVICTVVVRVITFPLMIICLKNVARMHNHSPHMVQLQEKLTAARMHGNNMEAAMIAVELGEYMKKHNINPFKNILLPMAQAPFFLSMFIGLRKLAGLPVASMATGGCLWFPDLTIPDPYYALPVLTAFTLLAVIEVGSDTGVKSQNLGHFKNVMRALPFVFLPFTITFPSAVLNYWFTNNAFSLVQTAVLKFKPVRETLGIPEMVPAPQLPGFKKKKKGFFKGVKDSMSNAKAISEIQDRERVSALKFKESGMGPIQKTFAADPTKRRTQAAHHADIVKDKTKITN